MAEIDISGSRFDHVNMDAAILSFALPDALGEGTSFLVGAQNVHIDARRLGRSDLVGDARTLVRLPRCEIEFRSPLLISAFFARYAPDASPGAKPDLVRRSVARSDCPDGGVGEEHYYLGSQFGSERCNCELEIASREAVILRFGEVGDAG